MKQPSMDTGVSLLCRSSVHWIQRGIRTTAAGFVILRPLQQLAGNGENDNEFTERGQQARETAFMLTTCCLSLSTYVCFNVPH